MTAVLSARAEDTLALLAQTLGGHKTTMLNLRRPRAKGRLRPKAYDLAEIQRQATLVRLVSITESFCASQLLTHAEAALPLVDSSLLDTLWKSISVDSTQNWEAQKKAFRNWFNVRPNWQEIDGLAEARNAVAHGLGDLTRRQLRARDSTMEKLNRTGIAVVGNSLALTDTDLERATSICKELISEVDSLLP